MKLNKFEFKKDGLYIDKTKIVAWDDLKIESNTKLGKSKLSISIYGNLRGVDDHYYRFAKPDK